MQYRKYTEPNKKLTKKEVQTTMTPNQQQQQQRPFNGL